MKSDARVRYTRMVIKNAFITLLKRKPLNKISVKQVCELAEINRATFYKHQFSAPSCSLSLPPTRIRNGSIIFAPTDAVAF